MAFRFTVEKQCPETGARTGWLETPHGQVETPVFMPVGTQGSVKAVHPRELKMLGAGIILGNAYHLYLRPGHETIARLGGLHAFTTWQGPILTDSGGYQVFSLAHIRRVSDDGILFRSHLDGSEHFLSPEKVMEIQQALGADIAMVLDEPSSFPSSIEEVRAAGERTHRWAARCLQSHTRAGQALFGIVQGGVDPALRRWSAETLRELDFPGYAIGGLSLGEPKPQTWEMVETVVPELPAQKPRYLMGVGSPEDLLEGISRGIDMFDSSFPTRIARNGALLTPAGRVNIRNARYRDETGPVLDGCDCDTCTRFAAAYLHHLFKCEELLAYQLASVHNLRFMVRLGEQARERIRSGAFAAFSREFLAGFSAPKPEVRAEQKAKWLVARSRKPIPAASENAGATDDGG